MTSGLAHVHLRVHDGLADRADRACELQEYLVAIHPVRRRPRYLLRSTRTPPPQGLGQISDLVEMTDRTDRARLYEVVLREGAPEDMLRHVDGVLLVDIWDELILPRNVGAARGPLIRRAGGEAEVSRRD